VGSKPAGQSVFQSETQAENIINNAVEKYRSVMFPVLEEEEGRWRCTMSRVRNDM
jgi:hypothetical protein